MQHMICHILLSCYCRFTTGRTEQQQAELSSSRQNPEAGRTSSKQTLNISKYNDFQWADLTTFCGEWHHDKECNQYHIGLSRIMPTKHCAQRFSTWWNGILTNSQSNRELSKSIRNTARNAGLIPPEDSGRNELWDHWGHPSKIHKDPQI